MTTNNFAYQSEWMNKNEINFFPAKCEHTLTLYEKSSHKHQMRILQLFFSRFSHIKLTIYVSNVLYWFMFIFLRILCLNFYLDFVVNIKKAYVFTAFICNFYCGIYSQRDIVGGDVGRRACSFNRNKLQPRNLVGLAALPADHRTMTTI